MKCICLSDTHRVATQTLSLKINASEGRLSWQGEMGVPRECSPSPSCLSCQNDNFQSQKLGVGCWWILIDKEVQEKGKKNTYAPNNCWGKIRNDIYPAQPSLLFGRKSHHRPRHWTPTLCRHVRHPLQSIMYLSFISLFSLSLFAPTIILREIRGKQLLW